MITFQIKFTDMNYRLPLMFVGSICVGFLLTSCNTWVGMGRDFQKLGGGVQRMGSGMENQAYKNSDFSNAQ